MHTKTLVTVFSVLGVILLPIGGWTLQTVSTDSARISVLEESKLDIKNQLEKMDHKLDRVLDEQAAVREALRQKGIDDGFRHSPLRGGNRSREQAP